jgi:lipoprotein-anchoring transpeptidase ErfK/SrfK
VLESDLSGADRRDLSASRRVRLGIMAVFGIVSLFAAACSSTAANSKGAGQQPGQAAGSPTASPAAQVTVSPANGTTNAKPNQGVSVTATAGKITNVTVTTGHALVGGALATDGKSWHTNWSLHTGAHYKVTVTAINAKGKTTTTTSSFRTIAAGATFSANTLEGLNQTYGVGMPIVITFSSPVTRKAAVEKAIQIKTSKPIVGAWLWDSDQTLAFRPQTYWPAHTKVSFVAHFNGLAIAPGVFGTSNLTQSFRIGSSLIGVTSTVTHKTRIYWKGKLYATWPDSSGMPGRDTANGTYLTIEKGNPVLMSGPGYKNLPVFWSVRFTWSGNYYHSAPWSVGEQGFANVSHGCVNLSPAHAQWYYARADPGDPITITGSPVAGTWDDGYTEWFYTWKQVLNHSVTHMAVQTSPTGSTFVDPSTLPAQAPNTFLTGSKPHNYRAK